MRQPNRFDIIAACGNRSRIYDDTGTFFQTTAQYILEENLLVFDSFRPHSTLDTPNFGGGVLQAGTDWPDSKRLSPPAFRPRPQPFSSGNFKRLSGCHLRLSRSLALQGLRRIRTCRLLPPPTGNYPRRSGCFWNVPLYPPGRLDGRFQSQRRLLHFRNRFRLSPILRSGGNAGRVSSGLANGKVDKKMILRCSLRRGVWPYALYCQSKYLDLCST